MNNPTSGREGASPSQGFSLEIGQGKKSTPEEPGKGWRYEPLMYYLNDNLLVCCYTSLLYGVNMIKPEEIEALKRERQETIERINQTTEELAQIAKEIFTYEKRNK